MEHRTEQASPQENKEVFSQGDLYIDETLLFPIKVREQDGQIQGIVNESNEPSTSDISKADILIDEVNLNAIKDFFTGRGVSVDGTPWTVEEQEDFLGYISISGPELNQAISDGRVILKKEEEDPESIIIEGLNEAVKKYIGEYYTKL